MLVFEHSAVPIIDGIFTADQAGSFLNDLCLQTGLAHFRFEAGITIAGSSGRDAAPLRSTASAQFDKLLGDGAPDVSRQMQHTQLPFWVHTKADDTLSLLCCPVRFGSAGRGRALFLGTQQGISERRTALLHHDLQQLTERLHRIGLLEATNIPPLGDRALDCLRRLANGEEADVIAFAWGMPEHAVTAVLTATLSRLRASNPVQGVAIALRHGLI